MKIESSSQVAMATVAIASTGIGRAGSAAMRDVGARILLLDLSEDSGQATESQMMQRVDTALFVSAHVSKQQDVQAYAKLTIVT